MSGYHFDHASGDPEDPDRRTEDTDLAKEDCGRGIVMIGVVIAIIILMGLCVLSLISLGSLAGH